MLLHAVLRPLGFVEFTDVYWIDPRTPVPQRHLEGYVIAHATDTDIDSICNHIKRDEPPGVIRKLWRDGHHCFVARHDGAVIAYDWIAFSSVQEEEFRIELEPDDAFCLNAYTVPEHRGKGVHYALLRALLEFAARSGKTRCFTAVSVFNISSWKSHARMGWQLSSTVGYFRPYFTLRRLPWQLTPMQYPVTLDWTRHSWLNAPNEQAQT